MFPDLTQKAKSGILRFLWQNDPFKAKWAILAKAYSRIRDEHSDPKKVPLETFLGLNAPFIGIVEPGLYLNAMGWELTADAEQQYTMARVGQPNTKEADISTNYSVNDVVKHCYDIGYVSQEVRHRKTGCKSNEPVMSFVAQPSSVIKGNNKIQVSEADAYVDFDDAKAAIRCSLEEQAKDTPTPAFSGISSTVDEASPVSTELPNGQNPLRFMDNPGVEFNWDLFANSMPGRDAHYDPLVPPLSDTQFDQTNVPCFPGPLEGMGHFDFDQFVNF